MAAFRSEATPSHQSCLHVTVCCHTSLANRKQLQAALLQAESLATSSTCSVLPRSTRSQRTGTAARVRLGLFATRRWLQVRVVGCLPRPGFIAACRVLNEAGILLNPLTDYIYLFRTSDTGARYCKSSRLDQLSHYHGTDYRLPCLSLEPERTSLCAPLRPRLERG